MPALTRHALARVLRFGALFISALASLAAIAAPQISDLRLVNADTLLPISGFRPLKSGATLDLSKLPAHFTIQVNPQNGTQSVRFDLNGRKVVESWAPFVMSGDNRTSLSQNATRFYAWNPKPGQYTLRVTPYSQSSAKGAVGSTTTIRLKVVGKAAVSTGSSDSQNSSRNLIVSNGKTALAERTLSFASRPGSTWYSSKIRVIAHNTRAAQSLSPYGGDKSLARKATGFFRTEKVNNRWWLIDPTGAPYFHAAIAGTSRNISKSDRRQYDNTSEFKSEFKDDSGWADDTSAFLRGLGFFGTGGWSEDALLRRSRTPLNYTKVIYFMTDFGDKYGYSSSGVGHSNFKIKNVSGVLPIFDPRFPSFAQELVRKTISSSVYSPNDASFIGWFSDNELPFKANMLDLYLKISDSKDPNRRAAENFLAQRKLKKGTSTARSEFLKFAVGRYYQICHDALRRYDKHHLYLGSRLYGGDGGLTNLDVWKASKPYVDVVSVNVYGTLGVYPSNAIVKNALAIDRPIMVTEFYAKGADADDINSDPGLTNRSGAGYLVKTQADRGAYYQNMLISLLENRVTVGAHWLGYMDNNPGKANAEASNTNSNKGIVNIFWKPYSALTAAMRALNQNIYNIIRYTDN